MASVFCYQSCVLTDIAEPGTATTAQRTSRSRSRISVVSEETAHAPPPSAHISRTGHASCKYNILKFFPVLTHF